MKFALGLLTSSVDCFERLEVGNFTAQLSITFLQSIDTVLLLVDVVILCCVGTLRLLQRLYQHANNLCSLPALIDDRNVGAGIHAIHLKPQINIIGVDISRLKLGDIFQGKYRRFCFTDE